MNKYRFTHLPGASLYFLYYLTEKVFWILLLQIFKHDIHGILELFIILPDLHGVDEIDQGCDFLFLISYSFLGQIARKQTFYSSSTTVFRSDCAKTNFLFLIYYCFPVRLRENKQKV